MPTANEVKFVVDRWLTSSLGYVMLRQRPAACQVECIGGSLEDGSVVGVGRASDDSRERRVALDRHTQPAKMNFHHQHAHNSC